MSLNPVNTFTHATTIIPQPVDLEVEKIICSMRTATPEEFDAQCVASPKYQLHEPNNFNTLIMASYFDNTALIEHIVRKNGKQILELGNFAGATPLYAAAFANKYDSAKKLIDLGAKVNALCPSEFTDREDSILEIAVQSSFPLDSIQRCQSIEEAAALSDGKLIKLLLSKGALIQDETALNELQVACLNIVKSQFKSEMQSVFEKGTEIFTTLPQIPRDVQSIILDYAIEENEVEANDLIKHASYN